MTDIIYKYIIHVPLMRKSNDNFRDIALEDLPELAALDRLAGSTFHTNFWGPL